VDDVARRAFLAVAAGDGNVGKSLELADPEARELIERAAVADIDADPAIEGRNLIGAAVRRELARRVNETDPVEILANRDARLDLERFGEPNAGNDAAELLLGWLQRRNEERD
jgi:DNA primase